MIRIAALLALLSPLAAHANLMTFDDLTYERRFDPSYTENGITVTAKTSRGEDGAPLAPYLEASWPFAAKSLDFVIGTLFVPASVDVFAHGSGYCATVSNEDRALCGEVLPDDDPMPYIWASGYINDALVSTFGFWRQPLWDTVNLSALGAIDRLTIEVKSSRELGLPGTCNGMQGCGQVSIDNLMLKPVPEPETIALLTLGILGAWLSRRRRV